jgi:hypothetical protein
MKKLLFLLPFGLLISACSNDFEVTAPWKEIPVVYGILSPQDTAHYIRIEKAFLDPDKSAFEVAQIADSLYYPESAITVWLERTDNQNRIAMKRVNGALEGYPRDPGVFADQPNWLYKANTAGFPLLAGKKYRLVIERQDGKADITAETTLPADFKITKPALNVAVPVISFEGTKGTTIGWETDENGVYFNIRFVIRIAERNLNGTLVNTQEFVWDAVSNHEVIPMAAGSSVQYRGSIQIAGTSFYNFLAQKLQKPAQGRYRQFVSMDIILDGGGKEIKEYLETSNANGGLTGAETFPNYSNISEGFGIFTSKSQTIGQNYRVGGKTLDSMSVNSITDTLGFVQ